MTSTQSRVLVLVGIGGTWYFLSKAGVLTGTGLSFDEILASVAPGLSAQAQYVQGQALDQSGAGNSPKVPAVAYVGAAASIAGSIAGIFAGGGAAGGGAGAALGISLATAGIIAGVVIVVYLAYRFLKKQKASMHTNDVRDLWQRQFVALHAQMGLPPLPASVTKGTGPGTLEMAEVIHYFDHDDSQRLWKAVQQTQDLKRMEAAANDIDRFLTSQGIPVQDIAA